MLVYPWISLISDGDMLDGWTMFDIMIHGGFKHQHVEIYFG